MTPFDDFNVIMLESTEYSFTFVEILKANLIFSLCRTDVSFKAGFVNARRGMVMPQLLTSCAGKLSFESSSISGFSYIL